MKLAHSRAADAPIADDLAAAEAALTAATERLANARARLADVDAVVADAQSRRSQLVEQAQRPGLPKSARQVGIFRMPPLSAPWWRTR